MADRVQQALESSVPALHDLEKRGIFTRTELHEVVRQRTQLEYALVKRTPRLEDFLRYIEYEKKLERLRVVRVRRLKADRKKAKDQARGPSDTDGRLRVHTLYSLALRKFKGNVQLWMTYLEYCKKEGAMKKLSKTAARAIRFHPTVPEFWIFSANVEAEAQNNSGARALLQRALRANPMSERLWHEMFRLELRYANQLKERREVLGIDMEKSGVTEEANGPGAMEILLRGGTATIVFNNALKDVQSLSVKFVCGFLSVLEDFRPLFPEVFARVCDALRDNYPAETDTYKTIAKYIFSVSGTDAALDVMREGVEECQTEEMYCTCIQAMQNHIEALVAAGERAEAKTLTVEVAELCGKARERGVLGNQLVHRYARALLQLGRRKEAIGVVDEVNEALPQNARVWVLRLRLAEREPSTCDCKEAEHKRLIENALDVVPVTSSSQVWSYALSWCEDNDVELDWLLARLSWSLSAGGDVSANLQDIASHALDATLRKSGPHAAQMLMDRLVKLPKPGLRFMWHCIELQSREGIYSVEGGKKDNEALPRLRMLLESALRAYGEEEAELWVRLWKVEKDQGGNTGAIYWRAVKALSDPKPFVAAVMVR